MLRAFAGAFERRAGAGGPGLADALRAAVAAEGHDDVHLVRAGPLTVACSGAPPARDGEALCLLEGVLDAPVAAGAATPSPGAERAVLDRWRAGGDAALAALRGDWALVLWDGRRGALARDHLGLRGLVHHDDGALLRFASEAHLLLRLLPATPGPDLQGLAHWVGLSAPPPDRTLLDGVHRLPAASVLDLDADGRRAPRRHWAPRYARPERPPPEAAAARLRQTLATAVARRSAGAERTAVLLSGGLDSSAVAGVARADVPAGDAPRRAYSALFPLHPSVDETPLIRALCQELRLDGIAAAVHAPRLLPGVLPYLERFATPPVSPNLFFWDPLLARAVADGTTVLLDGEGGDELYGLSPFLVSDHLRRGRLLRAARVVDGVPGAHRGVPRRTRLSWLVDPGLAGAAPAWTHALSRRVRPGGARPVAYLGPQLADAFDASAPGGAWKRLDGPRWWAFLADAVTRIAPSIGYDHQRRRAALAGILPRHPLVDVDAIELVLGLAPELAHDPHRSRPLLRAAVAGTIPDQVRLRPAKSTFDAVFHEALAGPDLPLARALLDPRHARLAAHVDPAALRDLPAAAPTPGRERQRWALQVWRLLGAECLLRHLEDRDEPRRTLERAGMGTPDVRLGPTLSTR
ncbi:asparagine synthase-related protein [Conexibacter sp. SYSU D00693]|uniref:asparagine synthase-related protein n=1 Tax=Conexibacter sp. SYSU D00693 TaxID=2812560 RepID=UPI00196A2D72|nr:asparagine synthase-related protein [Conexibacter sp. SYSU D00693]